MFLKLLILFTVIPLVELALLIEIGQKVGLTNTIALVILTGIIGAALARSQGFGIIQKIQAELAQGQIPADSLIHGAFILVGHFYRQLFHRFFQAIKPVKRFWERKKCYEKQS